MQNMHTRNTQRGRERERLSACSAVLAGFHIILCRSCPSAGKFSEITSFNYLLPTAAAALAGWCYTGTGWDLDRKNRSATGSALILWLLSLISPFWPSTEPSPSLWLPRNPLIYIASYVHLLTNRQGRDECWHAIIGKCSIFKAESLLAYLHLHPSLQCQHSH